VRAAVCAGDYRQLDELLEVYRAEVEASWRSAETPEQRREISTETTALLQWARFSILAARAHAQRKLIHLKSGNAYAPGASPGGHLSIEA